MKHGHFVAHLDEEQCHQVTATASRSEDNYLLLLLQQCGLQYLDQICLFEVLRHEGELLVQAFDGLLELLVSCFVIAYFHDVKVFFIDKATKYELLWE